MLLEEALVEGRARRKRIARRQWRVRAGSPGHYTFPGSYIDLHMDSEPRGFSGFVLTVEDLAANDWEIYWLDKE